MSYTVDATLVVDVSNPTAVAALAAAGAWSGGDQKAQVQAVADLGLQELQTVARRYGITISESSARVTEN